MQLAPLLSTFIVSTFMLGGCSDSQEKNRDDTLGSGGVSSSGGSTASGGGGGASSSGGSGASGGEGGADSNLYDPRNAIAVCTSMESRAACRGVKFDMSSCADCIAQCYWGTVAELYEQHPFDRVIGADGQVIDPPTSAQGGAGGDEGALTDEAACYVVAGDGG